jgi:hypothetical protein
MIAFIFICAMCALVLRIVTDIARVIINLIGDCIHV